MADETQTAAAATSPKAIVVEGVTITVKQPYAEGHALTGNEPSVLNQTFLENVRNNVAGKIRSAKAAFEKDEANAGKEFDVASIDVTELQTYADGYVFGARTTRASEPVDPVQREAHRIAKDTIDEALRSKGVKRKSLAEGVYDKMVETYVGKDDIQAEAKRRVKAREKIGADILAGIETPAEG